MPVCPAARRREVDYSGALFTLARLESALGKTTEAAAAYRKSYEANTADTRGLLALANSLFEHHQADRALRMLQAEVKRFPARNDLHLEYAILAERGGPGAAPTPAAGATLTHDEVISATRCVMAWQPVGAAATASPQSKCIPAAREMAQRVCLG